MKIKSVKIQGMHHIQSKSYDFTDNNVSYLYGPNGAGKSTVLEAIQLAILGYVPGFAKTKAAITSHRGTNEMVVTVEFDDGSLVSRSWKGATATPHVINTTNYENPEDIVGELELPIFNFSEMVGMTANKLKDWFIQFLPESSTAINWDTELRNCVSDITVDEDTLQEVMDKVKEIESHSKSSIELVRELNTYFKDELSYNKKELTDLSGTVNSLIYYDEEGTVGDDEFINSRLAQCRADINNYTKEKESLLVAMNVIQSNQSVRNQLNSLQNVDANFDESEVTAKIENLRSLVPSILEETNKLVEDRSLLKSKISELKFKNNERTSIIRKGGICPYTNKSCEDIQKMISEYSKEVESNNDEIASLQLQVDKIDETIQLKQTSRANYENEINRLNMIIMQYRQNLSEKDRLESLLKEDPDISQYEDLQYYSLAISQKQEEISKLEANKKYNNLIDKFTSEKFKIENLIEANKKWAKLTDANGLQSRIMNQSFYDFAEVMDKFIVDLFPGNVKCGFNLEEKANSFNFGIFRDGQYIKYELLSSGEKTIYTLAMMMCIIDKSKSDLKVLIIDDMLDHLDDDRANHVFENLQNIKDIQIIAAGVKEPKGISYIQIG